MKQSNSELYLDSCIHDDHVVCGKLLNPFTLKHYIRLELIESPIVKPTRELQWQDLEQAVAICSHKGSNEPLDAIKFKRFGLFKRMAYKVWHLWNYYRRDISKEYASFMEYVSDYCVLPEMARNDQEWQLSELEQEMVNQGAAPAVPRIEDNPFPWYLLHELILVKKTGWTPEYIESLPLSQIIWWGEGLNYLEFGKTRIKGDNFDAVMEIALQERADRERSLTPPVTV